MWRFFNTAADSEAGTAIKPVLRMTNGLAIPRRTGRQLIESWLLLALSGHEGLSPSRPLLGV